MPRPLRDGANEILEVDRLSVPSVACAPIDNVNVAVEAGQVFSIIGPNGSGKTTLFNLVSGIYTAARGEHPVRRRKG